MTPEVGKLYVNRAGAVLRVLRHERYQPPAGYTPPNPLPGWLLCVIERMASGDLPDMPCKVTVREDGTYLPSAEPHDLDLIAEFTSEADLPKHKWGWFTPKRSAA